MTTNSLVRMVRSAGAILALTGCTSISPPTSFHTLNTAPAGVAAIAQRPELSLGLGPIELPEMLKRPQLVIRVNASDVELSEFHQWAGDLEDTMTRTMAGQLMEAMGTEKVAIYPWARHRAIDYQMRVDVLRFDGALGGEVVLAGTWTLADGEGRKEINTRAFSFTENTEGDSHTDLVEAMSRLVAHLSATAAADVVDNLP